MRLSARAVAVGRRGLHTHTVRPGVALPLQHGGEIPADSFQITYATHGSSSEHATVFDNGRPIVYIMPSMSNTPFFVDSAAQGEKGWWNHVVGKGPKWGIDLNRFNVICASPIGSPFGSSSPLTTNAATGRAWGSTFPTITPLDMARAHAVLLETLGLEKVFCVVGGSMGGMQALHFASEYPSMYDRCTAIASTGHTSPGTVALRFVQRSAVMMNPKEGLRIARMIGTIGYRSRQEFDERFSWSADQMDNNVLSFDVERYLTHQANLFEKRGYDVDCYQTLSKAMDLMQLEGDTMRRNIVQSYGPGYLDEKEASVPNAAKDNNKKQVMLLPYSSDMLMPPHELAAVAGALGKGGDVLVHYEVLKTLYGHDSFLIPRKSERQPLRERLHHFLEGGTHAVRRFHGSHTM